MLQTPINKELLIIGGPNGSGKTTLAKEGKNIIIESTLAGKSLLNIINRFQDELGYTVSIVFIFLDSEEICIERIQTRVRKGGHPVPEKDVIRRFGRSIVNFWVKYRKVCDRWILYYNTEDSFQGVAHHQEDKFYVYDDPLFVTFKEMVSTYG